MFIYYNWFFFVLVQLMLSCSLVAMEEEGDPNPFPHLFQDLEAKKKEYEDARIVRTFTSIDELFAKSVIKVQKLNDKQEVIKERITDLHGFLSKPHKLDKISALLDKHCPTKFPKEAQDLLKEKQPKSFSEAVRLLWEQKFIALKDANELIATVSPMKAEEAVRLIENGASLTESGYFVQLRTGQGYGNALKLHDHVYSLMRVIKEKYGGELLSTPILSLLEGPHRDHVIDAFTSAGMTIPDAISDAHVLTEMRKYFSFLSTIGRITGFRPGGVGSPATIDPVNDSYMLLSPQQISAVLVGNYYFNNINASMNHSLTINPLGINYSGSMTFDNQCVDWWVYYSTGYLGAGVDYTINFDQGALWSNGNASYLSVGAYVGGWKNQISAGISLQTLLTSTIGAGASAYFSVSREHDVAYLGTYPLDGKFASIRGLHKVEIKDKKGFGFTGAVAVNFSAANVPIAIAFKAGADFTRARTYRTHTSLGHAQEMLEEGDLSKLLIKAGRQIKQTRVPSFEHPEALIDGDELVEIKTGKISGAFVIGLQTVVPIYAVRLGASIDLIAEFELGLRRLPNDKFEVSIEPRRVHEMSLFASMLNMFGAGQVKAIAIARKQIYMFDFKHPEARIAYFDLIHHGRLPGNEDIEVSTEERGPEYLLAEFRAQNVSLLKQGVQRTFLESINIETAKSYMGFTAPIIPAMLFLVNKSHNAVRKNHRKLDLRFEGKDREFMRSYANNIATNGLIAVRRETSGGRVSHGQGFSGRYNQDLFVTHRRVHSTEEKPNGLFENNWQFDRLIVHGQLEDTIITGDEENTMADMVNKLFSAYIGSFEFRNSKAPRVINLEREFSRREFVALLNPEVNDRVPIAGQASGIDQTAIFAFLKKLKNKHPDQQGIIVKDFVEGNKGLNGFAAVHQLLGAKPDDITITTESGYMTTIQEATNFIVGYSSNKNNKTGKINLINNKSKKNRKIIKNFYNEARALLREIDQQLRLLYDDQYLIDDKSPLNSIFGTAKVQELIKEGVRQDKTAVKSGLVSARKTILELMDLASQGFSREDRLAIYRHAKPKRLRLFEKIEILLDADHDLHNKKTKFIFVDLIDKINLRVIKLDEDEVMKEMDPAYVDSQSAILSNLSAQLEKIISGPKFVSPI